METNNEQALSQPILSAGGASDEQAELSPSAERSVEYIMAAVQEFASAWSLVGGRFDNGDMLEQAEADKARIKRMLEDDARKLAAALASAPAAPTEYAEAKIIAVARAFAERNAYACNVNAQDNWDIYGGDYIDDVKFIAQGLATLSPDAYTEQSQEHSLASMSADAQSKGGA